MPEDMEAIDTWDIVCIFAGAMYPPLLVIAFGQWFWRRSPAAKQWVSEKASKLGNLPSLPKPQAPSPEVSHLPSPNDTLLSSLLNTYHLLLVGHTRGGKTTLLHAMAREAKASGGSVVVLDADSITGRYPYPCYGAGDNYEAIGEALAKVQGEVEKRRQARGRGTRTFKPMWVFIDEAQDVFGEVVGSKDNIIAWVKRGAKLDIHIVIGTQDTQAKTLGLEGRTHTLINLARCDVRVAGGKRIAQMGDEQWEIPHLPSPDDTCILPSPNELLGELLNTPITALNAARKPLPNERTNEAKGETPSPTGNGLGEVVTLIQNGTPKNAAIYKVFGVKAGGGKTYQAIAQRLRDMGY